MTGWKAASALTEGDKVKTDDGGRLRVDRVSRGFARVRHEDGREEGTVFIEWGDGTWSQVGKSEEYALA